jgi:hypothetical protein
MMLGRRSLALSLLILGSGALGACATSRHRADADEHAAVADTTAGKADAKDGKDAKDAKAADEAEGTAEKIAKKEFDLQVARLELQIKRLSIADDERSATEDVAEAERGLRDARENLKAFQEHERTLKLDDTQLDLEQALQRRTEQEQELDELKAMYKQEELASLTKELVLSRGNKALEFAKRRLDLQSKTTNFAKQVEMPRKERELTETVAKSERKLDEARRKIEKRKLETQLDLMKAEHGIAELEQEIAKLRAKKVAA